MAPAEMMLAKKWYAEEGLGSVKIAQRLGRDPSTISRLLVKKKPRKPQGRKPLLSAHTVDKLEAKLEMMVRKADSQYEVTVAMLKRSSRCKASARTILKALHARGIYFRPLRQKPVLTPDDIGERLAFAKKYGAKSERWWNSAVHMIIDVKHFRVLPHGSARRYAAREVTRGPTARGAGACARGTQSPLRKKRSSIHGASGV